jgi:two-component system, probable response regulator PhcQ
MDRTVLLVDDDERLLLGLIRALRKQPFKIYTARNGAEAMWVLKSHDIDVIVADQRMPGMSGDELLAWVAENRPDVMRIILTGHAETDVAIRAINEASVCNFFTKPCNEARLAVAIHKAIERKDAIVDNRKRLDSSRQQLHDLERLTQDFDFQTRIVLEDLHRPLERMEECCQRLEEQCQDRLDGDAQTWLAETHKAAAEAHQLAAQLHSLTTPKDV